MAAIAEGVWLVCVHKAATNEDRTSTLAQTSLLGTKSGNCDISAPSTLACVRLGLRRQPSDRHAAEGMPMEHEDRRAHERQRVAVLHPPPWRGGAAK
eukprot:scaffold307583_cov32-Tisochrysis_lutea.AAC.2